MWAEPWNGVDTLMYLCKGEQWQGEVRWGDEDGETGQAEHFVSCMQWTSITAIATVTPAIAMVATPDVTEAHST